MDGLVIRNTGSHYMVATDDGATIACKVKGNFRIKGIRTTNPVAVGDRVSIKRQSDDSAYITAIEPRRNYIIRRATNLSKETHIIAANIDQALLIISLSHPTTSTTFIDRFLATAEAYRVPAMLVINKADLLVEEDDKVLADAVAYLYRTIGYSTTICSAETGVGIDDVRSSLKEKITLLAGNSGVGKSTIINTLLPDLHLRTAAISDVHDTGMHTTTFSEMFPLPEGGYIIDTPGVKSFGTIDFSRNETSHYFPEIFRFGHDCRYTDCTHTHEPGCAVRAALERHEIAESRFTSYLSILNDTDPTPDKYRKPF